MIWRCFKEAKIRSEEETQKTKSVPVKSLVKSDWNKY